MLIGRIRRSFATAFVALSIIFLITYQYVKARKVLYELQVRVENLNSRVANLDVSRRRQIRSLGRQDMLKPGRASISAPYLITLSFAEFKAALVPILEEDGWKQIGERHGRDWGSLSGIDEVRLHRENICAGIYYSSSKREAWFAATWDITGCVDD